MTAPQTRTIEMISDSSLSRGPFRYLGNKWFLLAGAGLAIVVIAAVFNWNWLVAAGVASALLSILPCLVMCGLGLCMCKFASRSGAAQSPGTAFADPTKESTQAVSAPVASYAASCCGGGSVVNPATTPADANTEAKENTHA